MPRSVRLTVMAMAAAIALAGSSGGAMAARACPEVGFTIVEPGASPQTRPVKFGGEQILQVRRDALTRTADIIEVKLEERGHTVLQLKFQPDAGGRLEDATTDHDGWRLAFVADDEALLFVTWEGKYGMGREGAQVSMSDSARARRLFKSLRACIGAPGAVVRDGR